jgi:hypothetical protein
MKPTQTTTFMEESSMRRFLLSTLLVVVLVGHSGCALPIYSGDPAIRTKELINTSEDYRMILDEWERIWFLDMPSHLSPRRVHGGIM